MLRSNEPEPSRHSVYSYCGRLFRFRLATLFWLLLLTAVLASWYRDRQQLIAQLGLGDPSYPSWSIDQLLGAPNTFAAGDISTAWAPKNQDEPNQWVIVEFPHRITSSAVVIHETYNPGAVVRIDAVNANGRTHCLWQGIDPTPSTSAMGVSRIALPPDTKTRRLKIYLNCDDVPGWNEIDAVGLIDAQGITHWATNSWASSSYGDNRDAPTWYWP
jgi:hypothetical protein